MRKLLTSLLLISMCQTAYGLTMPQSICLSGWLKAKFGNGGKQYCQDVSDEGQAFCVAGFLQGYGVGAKDYCQDIPSRAVGICLQGWLSAAYGSGGKAFCNQVTTEAQAWCLNGWLVAQYGAGGGQYCGVNGLNKKVPAN